MRTLVALASLVTLAFGEYTAPTLERVNEIKAVLEEEYRVGNVGFIPTALRLGNLQTEGFTIAKKKKI